MPGTPGGNPLVSPAWRWRYTGVFVLKKSVSDPLNVLSTRMSGYVKDHTSDAEPLKIGRDDEISDIADSYNKMNGDIRQYVSEIETMTQERVAASTELAVAQRIQQGLVPPTTELCGEGFEAFAFMRMARAVGGDFYQLAQLDDGRVMFMLADVSGKGVSAALFMAMCLTLLYERLEACKDPAEALNGAASGGWDPIDHDVDTSDPRIKQCGTHIL